MEDYNQKIRCTVETCQYNNCDDRMCELNQIEVQACPGCSNGSAADESMCGSYKCKCD